MELQERLTHVRQNGIKSGYWTEKKKDELLQRLGQYEDTGLSPEEIVQIKTAKQAALTSEESLGKLEEALDEQIRHGMRSLTSRMCFIVEEMSRTAGSPDELTFTASEIKKALELAKKKSA